MTNRVKEILAKIQMENLSKLLNGKWEKVIIKDSRGQSSTKLVITYNENV